MRHLPRRAQLDREQLSERREPKSGAVDLCSARTPPFAHIVLAHAGRQRQARTECGDQDIAVTRGSGAQLGDAQDCGAVEAAVSVDGVALANKHIGWHAPIISENPKWRNRLKTCATIPP